MTNPDSLLRLCLAAGSIAFLIFVWNFAGWIRSDAEARGVSPLLIAILFFCFGPITLLLWFVLRPPVKAVSGKDKKFNLDDFRVQ